MIEHNCEQYSDSWWAVRRGVPSASEFGRIITPAKGQIAAAHDGYISTLIGDLIDLDYPRKDEFATAAMRRGMAMEPEARRKYAFDTGRLIRQIGFCTTDDKRFGCSPDGLAGDDGVVELKNPSAAQHVAWARAGTLPVDHAAQCHGQLIVTGRSWVDFVSYLPGEPLFIVRVEPDEFTVKLRTCLDQFWDKYQTALAQFRPTQETAAA